MNIYFSHKFTNLQKKDIKLEFSKKITKDEKIFLKLLFFKIVSDSTFWKKLKSDLKKFFPYLNFLPLIISLHFLKLCRKNTYLFMCFLQTINFLVLLEYFHLLFYILIIANYFLLKNLKIVSH